MFGRGFGKTDLARGVLGCVLACWVVPGLSGCSDVVVRGEPIDIPDKIEDKFCIQDEVAFVSAILSQGKALTSCISESSCDRKIDTTEEGYFETWHLYADEGTTVVLEADSEFDNLMHLLRVTEVTEDLVTAKLVAKNDDRSANDSRALIAAVLEANEDYLLRLSSFGDDETGCYTIHARRDPMPPAPPATGSVEVDVSSTGAAPASYTVTLNDAKAKAVEASGLVAFEDIVVGDYAVELSGLGNCTVDGINPQDATVEANEKASVSFEVSCVECITDHECPQGAVCMVPACSEDGICDLLAAEDGAACEFNGGPGQCAGGSCIATTCDPPCTDTNLNDCMEPFCPEGATECDTRPRRADSDCTSNGKDGKCDDAGTCNICATVNCTAPGPCQSDSTCNPTTGTCNPFANKPLDTVCSPDGKVCDGKGACVECNNPSQCDEDANDCTARACDEGTCGQQNVGDGTACDLVGTDDGVCEAGVCVQAPECTPATQDEDCVSTNQCVRGVCVNLECSFENVTNGQGCTIDPNPGTCQNGTCVDLCVGVVCPEPNQCQNDDSICDLSDGSCNPHSNKLAGTACNEPGGRVCDGQGSCVGCNVDADCDDGNECNGSDYCRLSDRTCHGGSIPFCDDFNECTVNGCDPATGCFYANVPDGVSCSAGTGTCQSGECIVSCRFCCLLRSSCVDNGDGTVTDLGSGLMWIRDGNNGFVGTWQEAMDWAENLVFAGYDDWRLPDGRDRMTLLPDTGLNSTNHEWGFLYFVTWRPGTGPANAEDVLPWVGMPTGGGYAWTSTSNFDGEALAFFLTFDALGLNQWALQESQLWALAVRDTSAP